MADRTKPLPRTQRRLEGRELNRGLQRGRGSETNQRKDNVKNISIGLMDVDAAIMYYFNEVIKPMTTINGQEVKVPVYYANAERWNSIQKQGYVRDVKGSLITPLIVFRRVSMEANETMPIDKLDANDPKQFYTFEKKYSQNQRYDRFSVVQGLLNSKEYYTTAVPDYMNLNYEAIVWTPYIEDMNRIIEQINFSEVDINTAKDYGMHVAAHAHGDEGMYRAVLAGVRTIEHGTLMSERTMDLMIEKNAYLVPTMTAGKSVVEKANIPDYYPDIIVPKALKIGPVIQKTFSKAYSKGVRISFGTDAGVFDHGLNAKEFIYMVEAGMPETEAIQSATITNALILDKENVLGQISKGFFADIIATNDNPLDNINTLTDVIFVMKNGSVYKN